MRIVITPPDGLTKIGLVTTLRQFKDEFPAVSPPGEPTDAWLIAHQDSLIASAGQGARVSTETAPPAIDTSTQALNSDDARQPDGTWLQTWQIIDKFTLTEAKAEFAVNAIAVYQARITQQQWTAAEVTTHAADPVPITAARVTQFRPILNQARTAIQGAPDLAQIGVIWDNYLAAMQ